MLLIYPEPDFDLLKWPDNVILLLIKTNLRKNIRPKSRCQQQNPNSDIFICWMYCIYFLL